MLKNTLDWQQKEFVQIYDEITLWSAPFGRLLLDHIPMKKGNTVLDLGFGTGFPLIELSQRFGDTSMIYGVDIWEEAIILTQQKIKAFGIENIIIIPSSASEINLPDQSIDLITSNLGVNNFEEKEKVYNEVYRLLKPNGKLCITTNPIGTFEELFKVFDAVLETIECPVEQKHLANSIQHRSTKEKIIAEFTAFGLSLNQVKEDQTFMRFCNAEAVLNHSLIRVGFRAYWGSFIPKQKENEFYDLVLKHLRKTIAANGEFRMNIPMLYFEFDKK